MVAAKELWSMVLCPDFDAVCKIAAVQLQLLQEGLYKTGS